MATQEFLKLSNKNYSCQKKSKEKSDRCQKNSEEVQLQREGLPPDLNQIPDFAYIEEPQAYV